MDALQRSVDRGTKRAIKHFWSSRQAAQSSQRERGVSDQGGRAGVTAGKNMDGFADVVKRVALESGTKPESILLGPRRIQTVPGFYRATKNWDLLILNDGRLTAAIEFKSQVGPSFGNNFNNRVEEALGNATDLLTAYREGAFGDVPKPFLGYFFVLEECPLSMRPVRFDSPHFSVFEEFKDTSYAQRYEILCRKLVLEQLYDAAALLLVKRSEARAGKYRCLSTMTSISQFAAALSGKCTADRAVVRSSARQ